MISGPKALWISTGVWCVCSTVGIGYHSSDLPRLFQHPDSAREWSSTGHNEKAIYDFKGIL